MYGHYGRPALNASIAIGSAIVLYFLAPFGVIEFRGFARPENNWVRYDEAADILSNAPDALAPTAWAPGLIWVGLFIAALGATLLMVLGQQPLKVDPARWIGMSGGLLVTLGSAIAFMPAMYHVGTGFATFLGTLLFTDFRAQFWAITPVIVAVATFLAARAGLDVMVKVSASHDGIRDDAIAHADIVRAGLVFMAVVLIVPWSIGLLPGGVSDEVGRSFGTEENAPLFFSAQDVQGATVAEWDDHGRPRYAREGDWEWMKTTISLLVAAAWSTIAVGMLGAANGTLRSVGVGPASERILRMLLYPVGLVWVGAALFYVVSWFLAKPDSGIEATFLPGFIPILVPLAAYAVVKRQWSLVSTSTEGPHPVAV